MDITPIAFLFAEERLEGKLVGITDPTGDGSPSEDDE